MVALLRYVRLRLMSLIFNCPENDNLFFFRCFFAGNMAVIIHQIMIFLKRKKHGGQNVALCNRVMILNLATADLLTGIYLFFVAGNILYYSGAYCHEDKIWRTSTSCANLGLLNSIATEAAVVILVIMTTYR